MDNLEKQTPPPMEGSVRDLWKISLPLMISSLASLAMIFVDRIFLFRYSLDDLNASVSAGTLAWAFLGSMAIIASMSEVLVAQYNGAKLYQKLGSPPWQMIWFAALTALFFIPAGLWLAPYLFSESPYTALQIDYFSILMYYGPSYALVTAMSGFFIGRGKTTFLIYLAIIANIINIVLDWILIFGIPNIIPEMGIKGAAIATSAGHIFESVVLFFLFTKKKYRVQYGTGNYSFHFSTFKKCCKIGLPQGIFYSLEIIGWAIFFKMMTSLSVVHITVSSICQTIIILCYFFMDGLSRGITAIAGNFIGSKQLHHVPRLFRSALKLLCLFSLLLASFFLFDTQTVLQNLFATSTIALDSTVLQICLVCAFFYLFFEGIRWIVAGMLVAAGDTLFLLIGGSLSVWLFLLLPVYLIVVRNSLNVEYAWILAVGYSILLSATYWGRFLQGKWKKIDLTSDEISSTASSTEEEQQMLPQEIDLLSPDETDPTDEPPNHPR